MALSMFNSKKAVIGVILKAIISLIVGVVILLVIINIIADHYGLLIPEQGQNTAVTFRDFADQLERVANGSKSSAIVKTASIDGGMIIVVFSNKRNVYEMCQWNEWIKYPAKTSGNIGCDSDLCICTCDEDDACQNPYDCYSIENPKYSVVHGEPFKDFLSNLAYDGNAVSDVAIYGDCDGAGGEPHGTKSIAIERLQGGVIKISDNACANEKRAGKAATCQWWNPGEVKCPYGGIHTNSYVCEEGKICCV